MQCYIPGCADHRGACAITVIVTGTSEVSCFGGNDGSAGITVSGGTGPYLFQWTGNVTGYTSGSEDPINLVADTYDLTVTDNHGCIEFFDDLVIIDQPDDLVVTVDLITPVECHGEATGAVEITPSGGTPPYSFSWSGPGGFSSSAEDISGLESGTYSLTFTDSRGCMKEFLNLATVLESGPITAFFTVTGVSCSGGTDGAIDVAVSGGTPDYDYDWNGPFPFTSTLEDISNLVAGFYILRVTDAAGCM
ncbi:MAG: hypothetical protein EHM46_06970, partial [Bacteroidetes bacterium]